MNVIATHDKIQKNSYFVTSSKKSAAGIPYTNNIKFLLHIHFMGSPLFPVSKFMKLVTGESLMFGKEQESQLNPSLSPAGPGGNGNGVPDKIPSFRKLLTTLKVRKRAGNGNISNTVFDKRNRLPLRSSNITGKKWPRLTERKDMQQILWWDPPESSIPMEFCKDTSLHGLKYIGQQGRHMTERVFWLLAFMSGLIVALVLIYDVWNKYKTSPIIVSFDPKEITIDQVPFPAVTVCNMNKILKSKAEEYIERFEKGDRSPEAIADFKILKVHKLRELFGGLEETIDIAAFTEVNEFLRKSAQNCSDMIRLCIWQDQPFENCRELFNPIETEFGKCCTFGMMPQSELYKKRNDSRDDKEEILQWKQWNVESETDQDGVLLKGYNRTYPRRQMEGGKSFGLSFFLDPRLDEYYCTTSDSIGFRLSTHWPTDTPKVTDFGISVRTKSEVFVSVKPDLTLADQTIYKFPTDVRQCYREGEYTLAYFNYYTSSNCVEECLANQTSQACGCVRYYMPRSEHQPLCGGNQISIECAEDIKSTMSKHGTRTICRHCLPSCSEIEYFPQTTTAPLQSGLWQLGNTTKDEWTKINGDGSMVHVYFGQGATYARIRKELFGSTDLFANTGGLMSLCLGFSGLSLMEVIYFFTLRAFWSSTQNNGQNKLKFSEKVKGIWGNVKKWFGRNDQGSSSLDKQIGHLEEEMGKSFGPPPVYTLTVPKQYRKRDNNIGNESRMKDLENEVFPRNFYSGLHQDYKNSLGEI